LSIKSIPRWQYRKLLKHDITLHKLTLSSIGDDEYDQKQESYTSYSIKGEVQPITLEELARLPPGIYKEGDAWLYVLPYYILKGETIVVENDDEITCEDVRYMVERVEDHYQGNNIVWRRCYLKRVSGE